MKDFVRRPLEVNLCVDRLARHSTVSPRLLEFDTTSDSEVVLALHAAASLAGIDDDQLDGYVGSSTTLELLMARKFFGAHLKAFSYGQRRAPIYWQLEIPSRQWGVWLYLPRFTRETLFGLVNMAEERHRASERHIHTLQREIENGVASRSVAVLSKELDSEQKLSVELALFRDEAVRIANLGWDPDLDDGAVLNAAPLATLFPAWKDAAKARTELRAGKYEWATVAKFAGQL